MEILNLTRGCNVAKRRRPSNRDLHASMATGVSRLITNIPNPRAEARFSVGQRVEWNDCGPVYYGTVVDFIHNAPCEVRVRLDDGRLVDLPSFANSLRHASTPIPGVEASVAETIDRSPLEGVRTPTPTPTSPGVRTMSSGYYEDVSIDAPGDLPDPPEPDVTVPDAEGKWRR